MPPRFNYSHDPPVMCSTECDTSRVCRTVCDSKPLDDFIGTPVSSICSYPGTPCLPLAHDPLIYNSPRSRVEFEESNYYAESLKTIFSKWARCSVSECSELYDEFWNSHAFEARSKFPGVRGGQGWKEWKSSTSFRGDDLKFLPKSFFKRGPKICSPSYELQRWIKIIKINKRQG